MRTEIEEGKWVFSNSRRSVGKIIELTLLWGQSMARVWFPDPNTEREETGRGTPPFPFSFGTHHKGL